MRLATVLQGSDARAALVRDGRVLPLGRSRGGPASIRGIAAAGLPALGRIRTWADRQPAASLLPLREVVLVAAVPDPGAIFAIGLNYDDPDAPAAHRPQRPLVYAKLPTAVSGHGDRKSPRL